MTASTLATALLVLLPVLGQAEDPAPVTPAVQEIALGSPAAPAAGVDVVPTEETEPGAQSQAAPTDPATPPEPAPTESATPSEPTASEPATPSTAEPTPTDPAAPTDITPSDPAAPTETAPAEDSAPELPPVEGENPSGQILDIPAGAQTLVLDEKAVSGFSSLGVSWAGDAPINGIVLQVRTKDSTDAEWTDWTELNVSRAVTPSADMPDVRQGSDPYWFGASNGVEVAVTVTPGTQVSDIKLTLIDPKKVSQDANPEASRTGAAGAAEGVPSAYSRAQWGADESKMGWTPQVMSTIQAATVHHTADGNNYSAADVPGIMRSIYQYQAVSLGWGDIGYNVVVDKFGRAWEGRAGGLDKPIQGAHAGGFNQFTFGVSMLGNYDLVGVPVETQETVAQLIAWKFHLHGVNPTGWTAWTQRGGAGTTAKYNDGDVVNLPTIFGHRDTGSTACPGRYGYATLPNIRARAAQLIGTMNYIPVGSLERATTSGSSVQLSGWAFDRDQPSTSISVALYRNGQGIAWYPTDTARPDVNSAHGLTGIMDSRSRCRTSPLAETPTAYI